MASNRKTYITRTTERGRDEITESTLEMPYSFGRAVPRNGLMACLCVDKNTYSRKCCKGYLLNQGIGNIYGTGIREQERPWSPGFSQGFGPLFQ
jgi:hypothetical protein